MSRFPYRQEEKTFPTTPVCGLQAASVHASGSRQVLSTVKRRTCAVSRGGKSKLKGSRLKTGPHTHTHTRIIRISPSRSSTEREVNVLKRAPNWMGIEEEREREKPHRQTPKRGVWALISVHSPLPLFPTGSRNPCPNGLSGAEDQLKARKFNSNERSKIDCKFLLKINGLLADVKCKLLKSR